MFYNHYLTPPTNHHNKHHKDSTNMIDEAFFTHNNLIIMTPHSHRRKRTTPPLDHEYRYRPWTTPIHDLLEWRIQKKLRLLSRMDLWVLIKKDTSNEDHAFNLKDPSQWDYYIERTKENEENTLLSLTDQHKVWEEKFQPFSQMRKLHI